MPEGAPLPVEAIASGVARGELTALEAVEESLSRIAALDPKVGAFLAVDAEGARSRAAELDERRRGGAPAGRLEGVPFAIKDNLSVEGRPLTCGSRILEGYVAPYTATAVERLLDAGAVLVGRTNLDEFAMGSSCENSAFQPTRNPWDLARVPGGSSGGSAAAVAAGMVPLALGSDTGGSVRQPAALCGVVGLKPTYGRVSRSGLVAFASSLDQIGPLARGVRDAALALEVLSGHDGRDMTSARLPPVRSLDTIEAGIAGKRIGLVAEIDAAAFEPALRATWESSLAALQRLGAELVPVSVPNLEAAIAVYYVLANSEASANLARFDGVRYGARQEAPSLSKMIAATREAGFGSEVKRRIMLGTFALSSGYHDAYYVRARKVAAGLKRQFERAFEKVDLIATPTAPSGAFRLGEKTDDPLAMYLSDVFTTPANLTGLPAIAVPAGLDELGLPLSLQLLARPFDEPLLLGAARAFEREVAFRCAPRFPGAADAA